MSSNPGRLDTNPSSTSNRVPRSCKYFLANGRCRNGDRCPRKHSIDGDPSIPTSGIGSQDNAQPTTDATALMPSGGNKRRARSNVTNTSSATISTEVKANQQTSDPFSSLPQQSSFGPSNIPITVLEVETSAPNSIPDTPPILATSQRRGNSNRRGKGRQLPGKFRDQMNSAIPSQQGRQYERTIPSDIPSFGPRVQGLILRAQGTTVTQTPSQISPVTVSHPIETLSIQNSSASTHISPIASTNSKQNTTLRHPPSRARPKKSDNPCFLWNQGRCAKGDTCLYKHDPQVREKYLAEVAKREEERMEREETSRKREEERKAKQETRAAAFEARRLEQLALKKEIIENEAAVIVQHVVLGSAVVTCAAGVEIRGIVSGFDSYRIRIKGLPRDAKPQEIIALFSQQGVDSSKYSLRSIRPDGQHLEAEVLIVKDIGEGMIWALHKLPFRAEILRCEAVENLPPDGMDSSKTNDTDILTISWRAPSLSMIAIYDTAEQVQWAVRTKHQSLYEGCRINVEQNTPPTGPALRYYVATSVKITGLPADASQLDVQGYMNCRHVKTIKSNLYDLNYALQDLHAQLHTASGRNIKSFNIVSHGPDNGGYIKVQARFSSWDHAKAAMDSLQGRRLKDNYPLFSFRLPSPLRYSVSIPLQQYHAQKRRWDALAKDNSDPKGTNLRIKVGDYKTFLNLRGDDRKEVGALKVRVETMVKGEKLDSNCWHRSFGSPTGKEFLNDLYSKTGVFVRNDWRLHALKLFGDGARREEALEFIKAEVERLNFDEWTVTLKRQSVGFFVRKGLTVLKEELGNDAVTLDLTSTPCKLTIKGGESARHAVTRLMTEAASGLDLIIKTVITDMCPVCYEQVTTPIELGCGHNYCTSCFRHYLLSAPDSKTFPLVCIGNEDSCKIPIPIPILQRFLTPPQFDRLIETAVRIYIDQHPDEIRYCTTPDCIQIYTCRSEGDAGQCPSCFATVCTSCHEEAHSGMTCSERKLYMDPAEQERLNEEWAKDNGIKRCPKCSVWIEKTEGCNHMECKCGAHICWKCMGVFSSGEIYDHMNTAHGGIYDHIPADEPLAAAPAFVPIPNQNPPPHRPGNEVRVERVLNWVAHQDANPQVGHPPLVRPLARVNLARVEAQPARVFQWQEGVAGTREDIDGMREERGLFYVTNEARLDLGRHRREVARREETRRQREAERLQREHVQRIIDARQDELRRARERRDESWCTVM